MPWLACCWSCCCSACQVAMSREISHQRRVNTCAYVKKVYKSRTWQYWGVPWLACCWSCCCSACRVVVMNRYLFRCAESRWGVQCSPRSPRLGPRLPRIPLRLAAVRRSHSERCTCAVQTSERTNWSISTLLM